MASCIGFFSSPFPLASTRLQSKTRSLGIFSRASSSRVSLRILSAFTAPVQSPEVHRRSANYQPRIWEHSFIQSLESGYKIEGARMAKIVNISEVHAEQAEKLKDEVRKLLNERLHPVVMLELIDNLQHLGIGYLFDREINESLSNISSKRDDVLSKKDLHATSLLFRLLRDHGFQVTQDVFDDFMDRSGEFMDSLRDNTKGLLSLYEASYHGFEGESIIDKARAFSTEQLKKYMKGNDKMNLREQVDHALELPRLWRMQRLEALWFIDQYERQGDINTVLLKLAKLDFNMVQSVHQESLRSLSRWWVDLGLGEKLSYMRDRLPEHFLWGVGTTSAPQYRLSREGVTKDELKRGDVPKAIQCYMNDKKVYEEVSREHIRGLLSEKWKNINEDRITPSPFPREVVDAAIDLLRISQCIYQYGDGHGSPDKETKDQIMSLFIQPISLDA
ncbi:hypothetical protein QJS10_CPB11g01714 [Acorus calamus]|uniref:Uncharacterized protein n=1 Tax=Acorus calamus TaxID=4465 RepID=A0AAV9DXD9_ACOCL|nr:hypothetical protein QJS10_CPB11g01714 [Acorus calamus]